MQIRTRLTLQFVAIVAIIMLISLGAIYYFSSKYREREFYDRLREKAATTAQLLLRVQQVDSALLKIIDKNKKDLLDRENITVFNYLNQQIYTNNDTFDLDSSRTLLNRIRLEGEQRWTQGQYEVIGIPYVDKFNRFVVTAGAVDKFGLSKLRYLRNILLIVFFVSLAVVAYAGWIYAGRALSPINKIIAQAQNISASNLNERLDEGNRTDEIARLSATFNAMLQRLEQTFQMQKSFVTNASHELKNPLTVITSQLEVILLRERTPEEYRQTLNSVLEDIISLNSVALRLLDLARLSSDEIKLNFRRIRIDELLWQCRDEIMQQHKECTVNISLSLPDDERQMEVMGSDAMLLTAFHNLLDNACKYSENKQVNVNLYTTGSRIVVAFLDEGSGITEADRAHIFQPFYRGLNAGSVRGHGIGLSLVDRIVKLHKATIMLESSVGKGSVFTLTFPSASIFQQQQA